MYISDKNYPLRQQSLAQKKPMFFISMSALIRKHSDNIRKGMPSRMLTYLIKPAVLALDEIGYTPLDNNAATLHFDVIDIHYRKRKPIILTSNKFRGRWGEILPDGEMATDILDRLLHYSVTANVVGDSIENLVQVTLTDQKKRKETANVSNSNRIRQ